MLAEGPFVLLDDARTGASATLYRNPIDIVETREPMTVWAGLGRLRAAAGRGLHAAGFLGYELGYALERKLNGFGGSPAADEPPLAWFGIFRSAERIDDLPSRLPHPASSWASAPRPVISQAEHERGIATILRHIEAGDVYQANLTFAADVRTAGHPLALYAALRERAGAGHCGIVFTGAHWLLSFSPELFFTLGGGQATARPMKGTAKRGTDEEEDALAVTALESDPKQRAENLMIVDLLRNDLSRVARTGSVQVPALFEVETYPTVHQMTSTVTAEIETGKDAIDLIEALFPCGSVTGAPKIRAMEIIAGLEAGPRGPYCGSVGALGPDGEARFNVAIRTLVLKDGTQRARLGLGSGIVIDSKPSDEWRECLAKGAFVRSGSESFDLVETMRFDPRDGISELEFHLSRMKRSAEALGFAFDRHGARNELQAATFRLREPRRLRLRLSPSGAVAIELRALDPTPAEPVEVAIVPLPVHPEDFRLRHKTSERGFYDSARAEAGTFEVLFETEDGWLTEGSFTNLFIERGGRLLTPPVSRGLLPGILRERLIFDGRAEEADLTAADLAGGFFIGNAVRGLIPARLRELG